MQRISFRIGTSLALVAFLIPLFALARAGGGGSSSGGGGIIRLVYAIARLPFPYNILTFIAIAAVMYSVWIRGKKLREKMLAAAESRRQTAETSDSIWNIDTLNKHVDATFFAFQMAWTNSDARALEAILTPNYYKRIYLELTVLQNERRQNRISSISIANKAFVDIDDELDDSKDNFKVEITARAKDELIDVRTGAVLFSDSMPFKEIWTFYRDGQIWRLGAISQATVSASSIQSKIATFAEVNGFYYDPDFGWLMMPKEGMLFKKANFGRTDINNHVIGYYQDKVVEFYTMAFLNGNNRAQTELYLIGQAILPISYKNILVRHHSFFSFGAPAGLVKHQLESNQFNKEFEVHSAQEDNISTFQLLHPAFMEYIMGLPFSVTIEVVGNTLYFYTSDLAKADYEKLLGILSRAFDELRRP